MKEGTDWAWCFENPRAAAALIDQLEAGRDALRRDLDAAFALLAKEQK